MAVARTNFRLRFIAAFLVFYGAAVFSIAAATGDRSPSGLEHRRQLALSRLIEMGPDSRACPPSRDPRRPCNLLSEIAFGLGALYRGRDSTEITAANDAIATAVDRLSHLTEETGDQDRLDSRSSNRLLVPLNWLARIYFLFGDERTSNSKRLTQKLRYEIPDAIWNFAKSQCKVSDANPQGTWRIRGSENIDIVRVTVCWGASEIFFGKSSEHEYRYTDGTTPSIQLAAWTKYLKSYITDRAKYGGFIEFFSPTYYKYTLMNFYTIAEFSSDVSLRKISSYLLDFWFSTWAEEQIDGVHGGSETRVYPNSIGRISTGSALGWLYFGIGSYERRNSNPAFIVELTSPYRPPKLVADIALHNKNSGYEVETRQVGLLAGSRPGVFDLNPTAGGIVRYTFVNESFVMGTTIRPKLPAKRWMSASSQNQRDGVVLVGGRQQYVFVGPDPAHTQGRSPNIYNAEWGVQSKTAQIIQKLPRPYSVNAGEMVIQVGAAVTPVRQGDWIFIDSGAYVAFRPAFGGYKDDTGNIAQPDAKMPKKFVLQDDLAPVIIQAADRSKYKNFAEFKAAVLAAPLTVHDDRIQYQGLNGAGAITFYTKSDRLPEIDGVAINLAPSYSVDSPFVKAKWGEGIVRIQKAEQKLVLDFRN